MYSFETITCEKILLTTVYVQHHPLKLYYQKLISAKITKISAKFNARENFQISNTRVSSLGILINKSIHGPSTIMEFCFGR